MKKRKKLGKKKGKKKVASKRRVELPTEYREPVADLDACNLVIHGEKKIGKTTLAIEGGKVLLLQCDPPRHAYRSLEYLITSWSDFLGALGELERQAEFELEPVYDRIVMDGADIWFKLCQADVCARLAVDHPNDAPWGKGWDALRTEFTSAVRRLLLLPVGVWFLCHSSWKEKEDHDGNTSMRLVPALTGMAEEILNGVVDAWFAYDYIGNKRVLFVRGNEKVGAGNALDQSYNPHFRNRESGELVQCIPMGEDSVEAYVNLRACYGNDLAVRERYLAGYQVKKKKSAKRKASKKKKARKE